MGLGCLFATTAFSAASPWVFRYAIDDLGALPTRQKLLLYAGAIVAIAIVEGVFRYGMRMVLIGLSREVEYELRNDLYGHLLRQSQSYYQASRIGDIMSRASSDVSAVRMVLGPGIMYTANTLATFVASALLMAKISAPLLGLSLVPLLLVSFLARYFGRRIHDRFEKVQEQLGTLTAFIQENLSGARVVRAYAQERYEMERYEDLNQDYLRRNRELIALFGSLYPGIQLLMGVGAILVLWLGGRMVVFGTISLGEFVAFGAYLAMLHWPMIALGWVVNLFERGEASMGRIAFILDAAPTIRDENVTAVQEIRGEVEFRGLSFSYGGEVVLEGIDLKVPAGSTVAIVGPTACGKSTLVSLIPRLHDAPPGTLLLDGVDIRQIPLDELRGAIGFVPQETFLFSKTVRENIALGIAPGAQPGASMPAETAQQVEQAALVSQLAKDVRDFPRGYETFVGERGITLSGGQRQRAAIARALATDPRILVLDDALSAVDTHTEEEILRGLREAASQKAGPHAVTRTTFLVSHRVSTVRDADLIVVLREGRIVERGSHQELVALRGFYADLYRRQLLEQEMEVA